MGSGFLLNPSKYNSDGRSNCCCCAPVGWPASWAGKLAVEESSRRGTTARSRGNERGRE